MNTLILDTCFAACSVAAIWSTPEGRRTASRCEVIDKGHAERLMPMIEEVMAEAPFAIDALERIVVTTGPGTFTGQRVGIAVARALALASGASISTTTSLAAMAATAVRDLGGGDALGTTLAVAVDARRGEIYLQIFAGEPPSARSEAVLTTPETGAAMLDSGEIVAVGSAGEALADAARARGLNARACLASLQPDAAALVTVEFAPGPARPLPLYLRPPDAKPPSGSLLTRVS